MSLTIPLRLTIDVASAVGAALQIYNELIGFPKKMVQLLQATISREEGVDADEGVDKAVDLLFGVVAGEGCAHHSLDPEGMHEGLGAVVAGAHLYAELVEEHACVVVVGVAKQE